MKLKGDYLFDSTWKMLNDLRWGLYVPDYLHYMLYGCKQCKCKVYFFYCNTDKDSILLSSKQGGESH